METKKLNEDEYEIQVYDWVDRHDDYVCGHVKRDNNAEEDSDLRYWMFYPIGTKSPLNAGDLRSIADFTASLNIAD